MSAPMNESIGDTLALLNVARMAFGQEALTELPDARQGDSSDCLYYRAMADVGIQSVGGGGEMTFADSRVAQTIASLWDTEADGATVQAPAQFGRVIGAFDNGRLKHYSV
jgi:hypothetical protein